MKRTRILGTLASLGCLLTLVAAFAISTFPFAEAARAEETIHRVEGDVEPPKRTGGMAPKYPEMAKEERIEGTVMLKTVIDSTGQVTDIEVIKSIGPSFDEAAKEALATWTFKPAILNGHPVAVHYVITINFRLDADKKGADSSADDA